MTLPSPTALYVNVTVFSDLLNVFIVSKDKSSYYHMTWHTVVHYLLIMTKKVSAGNRMAETVKICHFSTEFCLLTIYVTSAPSLSVFRSRLKSHLFERSFPADS